MKILSAAKYYHNTLPVGKLKNSLMNYGHFSTLEKIDIDSFLRLLYALLTYLRMPLKGPLNEKYQL